ncbi:MAG: hypothetical protein RIR18_379 [Pseudomonadota bacterium]|jgi:magnesium transporter
MQINCVAYQNGQKLGDITQEAISDYLLIPNGFVWVALVDASSDELSLMQEEFTLHPLAVEDAHHGHQRPKIEEYGDSLFAVLHLLEWQEDELTIGEVDLFVGENYVLSVRSRSQQNLVSVRQRCEREPEMLDRGAGFVFYALMDAVVDRYFPIVDRLESQLEEVEERIFHKGRARQNIQELYALKRQVMILKHAVAPLMEAVSKLTSGRVPRICNNSQEYFRDVYDHLARMSTSIEAIRDTIGTAIQVNLSMVAIEEGEVNKRLAAWAGIFAVATAFVGVWGMNFTHMPELNWTYGYPAALALIVSVCGGLYVRFKRLGWL